MSEDFEIVLDDAFNEYGHPTKMGRYAVIPFTVTMEKIFSSEYVKYMTIDETKALIKNLNSIMEKMLSKRIEGKEKLIAQFAGMSDEQFMAYLKVKYGKDYMLISLPVEEYNRLPEFKFEHSTPYKDYSDEKFNVVDSKISRK